MKKIRPGKILEGTIKNLFNENTQSSTDRLQICKKCDKLKKGICTVCGCIVKSKTKVLTEYCPMNKWNDTKVLNKAGIAIAIKNPEKATLTVDEEGSNFIFNYGKIKQKSDTKLELVIINDRGNFFSEQQDLTKIKVAKPCSCTTSSKPPKELKEGNSFDYDITYSAEQIGVFSKKAHFVAEETTWNLILKGEVYG